MSTKAIETLHLRALEQRSRLHESASELREKIQSTRDKLRFTKQARDHPKPVSVTAGLLGIAAGYGLAGLFMHR